MVCSAGNDEPRFCAPPNDLINIGLEVSPTAPPPPPPPKRTIPWKLLQVMRKYKFSWRIKQLAKSLRKVKKFVPKPVTLATATKPKPVRLTPETTYYTDQMARPALRPTVINKQLFGKLNGQKYVDTINKIIEKSWDSKYNYYKKKQRDRRIRKMKRDMAKKKPKKKPDMERCGKLSQPKPVFKPPAKQKPKKVFSNYGGLEMLAAPKERPITKERIIGWVSPTALTYQPTETIVKMAQLPEWKLKVQKPKELGTVKRTALRYKATPRLETLAVPKKRTEIAEEDDFDPWAISKNALKYKPTPRILELAKPKEYD